MAQKRTTLSTLKLVSLNIEGRCHLVDRVLPFLIRRQPDVICLQEVFVTDLVMLERELGMTGFFSPMAIIDRVNSHFFGGGEGEFGVAILHHSPVKNSGSTVYAWYRPDQKNVLPHYRSTDYNSVNRVLAWVDLELDGLIWRIATTHFTRSQAGRVTVQQRRHLSVLMAELGKLEDIILCGDFNAPRGRAIFSTLASRYHDTIPTRYTTSIDPHLHEAAPLELMVDGLFLRPAYQEKTVSLVSGVSDHQAIVATIGRRGGK